MQFAVDAPELPRLILSFMRVDAEKLCTSPAEPERQESPARLTAAFCSADGALAGVSGTAGGPNLEDTERLVWRTTAFLLPDDYPDTYGLHLFGDWLRIGVNGSFGFWTGRAADRRGTPAVAPGRTATDRPGWCGLRRSAPPRPRRSPGR